ncbi:MAG: hypothetical protein Fur005_19730 [Roseiflexaceae bacterium]
MNDIEKALQPTVRMLMYTAEGVRIFLVGNRERLWIEGLPAGWETLNDFLLQAFEDETLPRRIMAGETGMNGISILPTNEVASHDPRYRRWQEQLRLTGREDPPLEFVRITAEGSSALLLMPMNAFHEWPIDWSNDYEYWKEVGIACLNHAEACNPSYNLSRFIRSMRSEAPTAAPLPSNAATELLQDALVGAADAWLRLPRANQLSQIWLRSLLRMPQLEPFWIELIERLKPFYMARKILRGLTPKTRKAVIARQSEELQAILNAHCSSKWDFA